MSESLQAAVASIEAVAAGYALLEAEATLAASGLHGTKVSTEGAVEKVLALRDAHAAGNRPATLAALELAEAAVQQARAIQDAVDVQIQSLRLVSAQLDGLIERADDNLSTFADEFRRE